MRMLCIKSGFSDNKDTLLVKRGSIYNVTKVIRDKYNRQYKTDIWYELLETGSDLHLGCLFVLLPEETETSIRVKKSKEE
jgi:hypothetical protein